MKASRSSLIFLILFFLAQIARSESREHSGCFVIANTDADFALLDANDVEFIVLNNGIFGSDPGTGQSGLFYPRASKNALLYGGGLWITGKIDHQMRSACGFYETEYQPGRILPSGLAADSNDPSCRLYKITRGDTPSHNPDYADWPWQYGAPADAVTHAPIFYGDQQAWGVFNDLGDHSAVFQTQPLGVEVQFLFWCYKDKPLLRSVIFAKFVIENKSGKTIEDACLGFFLDPDLGGAGDDLVGCDTTLDLGYAYNADGFDDIYERFSPALGFNIIRGPNMPASGDSLFSRKAPLPKNSPSACMTAFMPIFMLDSIYYSPRLQTPEGISEARNMMQGLLPDGSEVIDPYTMKATRFPLPGDPVTKTGFTGYDIIANGGADVKMVQSTGLFQFRPGEKRELVVSIQAALDRDRGAALSAIKNKASAADSLYLNDFVITRIKNAAPETSPEAFVLDPCYPNPFNLSTTIRYSLRQKSLVDLAVYDLLGRRIRTLVHEVQDAAAHETAWDGKDEHGIDLESGMYIYQIRTERSSLSGKMILLK